MAVNDIQMQPGLSLSAFIATYGTEAQCEAALAQLRWPQGFVCPRCGGCDAHTFRRRNQPYWLCRACQYQCSLRVGTMMERSHLPLTTWFMAIYLITQSKTNMAALELRRHLGVSYPTAWLLKHKIMEAMRERESTRLLDGDVRADDAYLGGERSGGTAGRGSQNKVAFVAAVEMHDERPIYVRFDPVESFSFKALSQWAERALTPGSEVTTDGLLGFEILGQLGHTHRVVLAPRGKAGTEIPAFRWLNTVLGNVKTALSGTYHAFSFRKYAARYLGDMQYRFNRRFHMAKMVPRLAVALLRATPCTRQALQAPVELGI